MDLGISGRLALVTGASRGIGRGIAQSLAEEGARLVLVARTSDDLEAARAALPRADEHVCLPLDLLEDDAPERLAASIAELGPLDIVVHNVGGSNAVWANTFARLEEWAKVWSYNLGVAHRLNAVFVPGMVRRGWGRVVFLSTLSTRTHKGYPAYVSAKSALDGYVKNVSRELAKDNVVVTAVAPGAIRVEGRYFAKLEQEDPAALERYFDDFLPARRLGLPSDVGPVVAFLCSDQAAFMAGSIVAVDGGGS